MISLVESQRDRDCFFSICQGTAFGCKLGAIARAYGFSRDFLRLWSDGTAAYGLLDGEMTIAGYPGEPGEAREFIQMIGPGSVLCDGSIAGGLGLTASAEGAVMAKDLADGEPVSVQAPGLREIYALLIDAGMAIDFEPFYLDMSHRLRHGAALALGRYASGELTGCGVVSAVTEKEAVLSAIAVREDCRRLGIGTELMKEVEQALPGRRLYLFRESSKNREFYRKLGFTEAGRWSQKDYMER